MTETAEQINTPFSDTIYTGESPTPFNKMDTPKNCTKCKANIRQQVIEETEKLIRKHYIPGEDADILIKDLQQFKRGE